jgi:cation diffusion facilitator CzcD-associated flavoprotein CzcO
VQHPDAAFAVLDDSATIGGVWAEHRLYPGLKSNNMLGTYEYPDFPMDPATFGVNPGEHIPGNVIHAYLEAYAKHFGFSGLIRFKTKVVSVEHEADGGWILTIITDYNVAKPDMFSPPTKLFTRRLIVASGLTSEPFIPHIDGQEIFEAPLFHAKDFLKYAETVDPTKSKRVTVFGGTKFAWDAVYTYGMKGISVDWVIRGKLKRNRNSEKPS